VIILFKTKVKKFIVFIIVISSIVLSANAVFAGQEDKTDTKTAYLTWIFLEDPVPIYLGTDCQSNLSQEYYDGYDYVQFQDTSNFAMAYEFNDIYPYSINAIADGTAEIYQGTTL